MRRVEVVGGRDELRDACRRGLGGPRGAHAAPAVRRRGEDRVPRLRCADGAHRATSATRGSTPGIVPFSTHALPRPTRRYWETVVPGRLHHRVLPRPVPQLVLLAARDEHRARDASRRSGRSSGYATLFGEDGRPMHKSWGNAIEFDEAAERMGVDVMRWMYANAAPGGQHPLRLARRGRGAPRAARAVERVRVLRHVRPASPGWTPGPPGAARSTGPHRRWTAGSCRALAGVAGRRGRAAGRLRRSTPRPGRSRASSTTSRPGTCASAGKRFSRSDDAADRDAAFATLPPGARRARARCSRRSSRSSPSRCTGTSSSPVGPGGAGERPPHALAGRGARGAIATRRWRPPWPSAPRRRARPVPAQPGRASSSASRWRALWLALPGRRRRLPARTCSGACADEINVKEVERHRRRVGAGRAAGEAAAAEDRQEARRRDPGGHGRGPRGRRGVPRPMAP